MKINLESTKYNVYEYNSPIKIIGNIIVKNNIINFTGKIFYTESLIGHFNCDICKNINLIRIFLEEEDFNKSEIEAMINNIAKLFKLEISSKL